MKYHWCSLILEGTVVLFVLFCGSDASWWSSNKLNPKKSQERLITELSPDCGKLDRYSSLILQTLLQHAYFIDRLYPASLESPDGDTIDLVLQFLSPVCGEWSSGFTRERFLSTARSNQVKFADAEGMTSLQKENLWPFTTDILMVPQDSHYYVKYILKAKDKKQMAEYSRVVKLIGDKFRAYLAAGPERRTTLDSDIDHQNIVNAWILLLVRFMSDEVNDCHLCKWIGVAAFVGVLYGFAAFKWGWIPFRPDLTSIPTTTPVPNSTTVHTDTPPILLFTIITILALICIAIVIFYYYYRKRKGSKSTSCASTSSNSKTRSRSSGDKKKKKSKKDGKHKKDDSFLSNCPFLSNFASWAPQSKLKNKSKKGGKHSKVSSIVPSQSSAVSNSSAVSSSPITRLHDKKKKKVRKDGKHSKGSSIYNSNSSIVSSSPITQRQSSYKKEKKKSPKGGKNRKK